LEPCRVCKASSRADLKVIYSLKIYLKKAITCQSLATF